MISRKSWAGGFNYQLNLFNALSKYCPRAISPIVFAGERHDPSELQAIGEVDAVEVVRSSHFDRPPLVSLVPTIFAQDRGAISCFRTHMIDAVWENARFFGWKSPYPTAAWIPDLQHRQLPHLFSTSARWRRELGFQLQILAGRTIVLSSQTAEVHCLAYYPKANGRTAVVKFAAEPSPELLKNDPLQVLQKYEIPRRYFYLPNQFWRHKNHKIVLDALALLSERGIRPVVVASGGSDPNEPEHLKRIVREAADRGLTNQFRHLGMIPLPEVYALLRASAGLINPSLFEGWSTTVEEAKSFGVPMILSNIDVHREQAADRAIYFDPNDAQSLAVHLQNVASSTLAIRDLNEESRQRVRQFAENFVFAIEKTVAK